MTKPNDFLDKDFRSTLPAELQELDRELSGIRIEERPSFGPELEAELVRAWRFRPPASERRQPRWVRGLMVAGLAGLLVMGASVSSVRASVARMVQSIVATVSLPASEPELPVIEVSGPSSEVVQSDPVTRPSPPAPTRAEEPEVIGDQPSILPEVRVTFPALVSRHEAEALIATFYPLALQRAGVGGSVKLWIWVDEEGTPEVVNMRGGSGYRSLNWAAVRAARELRFQPATRNGHPVGTWVEFDVHFVPGSGVGIVGLDPAGSEGIGGL